MFKNILLGVDTTLKNEKALKEVSKLAGKDTVVTIMNTISEQDAQASIKSGVHLDKLVEKRSEGLESTRNALEEYGIKYDEIIVRGNPKEQLVKEANSGKYEIIVLSNRRAEEKKKFVLGSVSHKVAKRASIPVLIVK
ncbi:MULTISPECIES: universal stress protein [Staphylococcus]|jgi:nucleotide-binding universal stress UspA family protein|uniref:Universal stress protein n=1 Tax=Staphylococcus nepalensis TaxID=214473 RepID=A0A291JKB9_9STAP|nr:MULTISPECIES: universal stress protein [Staphylococcus]VDG66837.1 universal stress protein domain-containing protein, UspA family [Lacrimispora indolis]ATH59856.1 universal stress protein UspA [Staphylococcus nepalensis]ATH64948.1 universal stress protein UspA [Staphylococcus nepalensis]AWI44315.1 universal stress protein UspA [Staphylococcus nepalensis]MBO1205202.1 universal stress protein [Staphylococcus nepalensis]